MISLIALIKKNILFKWTEDCQKIFNLLKTQFIITFILTHFNSIKKIIVKTDISDWVFTEILSQYEDDNIFYLVTFFLKKYSAQEINYEIYDKELLVIICVFKKWCSELKDSVFSLRVITNHWNLKYFMSIK